jgi:hypothetical protein
VLKLDKVWTKSVLKIDRVWESEQKSVLKSNLRKCAKVSLCTAWYSQKHGRVSYEEERKRKQEVTALICNFVLQQQQQQQQQEKSSGSQHIKLKTKNIDNIIIILNS